MNDAAPVLLREIVMLLRRLAADMCELLALATVLCSIAVLAHL